MTLRPGGTTINVSLPGGSSSTDSLPTRTASVLPGEFVHKLPPLAPFGGEGTLSAVAAPAAVAQFGGSGSFSGLAAASAQAGFTGEGELKEGGISSDSPFAGAGALFASAVPTASALFSGTGGLSATAAPSATAAFTGSGGLNTIASGSATAAFNGSGTASAVGAGRSAAAFSGSGGLTATARTYTPAGMNKSGSQSLAASNSYTQVTGWTADTTNYPGSTVSSNGLVIQSTGNAALSASCSWTGSPFNTGTGTIQLYKNGTLALTGAASAAGTSGTSTVSGTVSCTAGDVITLYFLYSIYTTGMSVTATSTWVHAAQG